MLLIDRFLACVGRAPEAPAIIWQDRPISYRLLLAYLSNAVRQLHREGITPGLVVGVDMRQGPLHLVTLLALARLGAVAVPLFAFSRAQSREAAFRSFAIGAVVADYPAKVPDGVRLAVVQSLDAKGDESALDVSGFTPVAATPMRIGLTSGTAGSRKGILLTHEAFVRRLARRFYGEGFVPRVIPPTLHVTSALQLASHTLCAGGTIVFPSDEENAQFVAAIERHAVTHVTMPAVHLSFLLDTLAADHAPLPSLRHVRLQGGMPSAGFIERVRRHFSPHVFVPYSTTEVGVIALATPETLAVAPQASGRVAPDVRLEILDEHGRTVGPGMSGEIRVQLDGMPEGYAGSDQGTPRRFRDGWFYPQDRGRLTAEGLLFVEGRVDDVINVGGRKLSPRHAETLLEDFPGVREAAVYPFEDDAGAVHIAAAVVPAGALDWKALDRHARGALGVFAPARYNSARSLPRNAAGKLQRKELAERARGEAAPAMLLIDRILGWVERTPGAAALVWNDQPVSYRLLLAYLSNTVRHLHQQGIGPGQTVGLAMSQGPLHLIALLALARLGALIVPLSPLLRPEHRAALARKYDLDVVVAEEPGRALEGVRSVIVPQMGARGDEAALDVAGFVPNASTPMRIALTSGTTGVPRGVLQTHGTFVARLDRTQCDVTEEPRVLPPNLHITTALNVALHALSKGGAIVFPRGYDSGPFFEAVHRHRVTHIGLAPANLAIWLPQLPDGPNFPSIRHLRLIGSTPSPAFLELARRRVSPHVFVPYGMAELGLVSMATPDTLLEQPRSSGRLLPGVKLETLDEAGKVLPAGATGEIRVACDGWPASYYGPDAGDRNRFRDGWFHPGDRGRMSDGLLFVEGRLDDIINIGGRKVSPGYVEAILEDHPAVREAAVFVDEEGVEGVRIAAAIVRSAALDWKDLAGFGVRALEVRAPVRYYEVESLPRDALGKLVRPGLAQWVRDNAISRSA